ncbi:MAG: hydroxysqualene dehydroxylase HpnE [Bacteroidota bacterium]|nr:hydroxysqualene dehydroxylase HpnE [Bacteroidota bacterium]
MSPSQNNRTVLVIGGGVAGLAAAVELASKNLSVLLVEQKQHLGGRAYSFLHNETDDEIDNGQHLMMGCYHNTLRLLDMIGSLPDVSLQSALRVAFRHPEKGKTELHASSLPAPFHLLSGLLGLKSLSLPDRFSLLRVGAALVRAKPDRDEHLQRMTVSEWLRSLHQSEANRKYLWDILAIGTLNDTPERVSASLFVKVLQAAFLGKQSDSAMAIPRKGLSRIFGEPAADFLRSHGGEVRMNTAVERVVVRDKRVSEVMLSTGEIVKSDAVISAVPYFDLPKLFDKQTPLEFPEFNIAENFISSSIVTIHLWFDTDFAEEEFVALLDSPIHWVFNKTKMYGKSNSNGSYLSLVISGAEKFMAIEKEELAALALTELKKFFPESRTAALLHSLVIKEKRATFSPRVGTEQFRPSHSTSIENLFLAGDWTDTKLPATIEGAVQSGFACAEAVKKMLG